MRKNGGLVPLLLGNILQHTNGSSSSHSRSLDSKNLVSVFEEILHVFDSWVALRAKWVWKHSLGVELVACLIECGVFEICSIITEYGYTASFVSKYALWVSLYDIFSWFIFHGYRKQNMMCAHILLLKPISVLWMTYRWPIVSIASTAIHTQYFLMPL